MPTESKAEHWRARAEEARAVAEGMTHPETKATMLEIAVGYEKMCRAPWKIAPSAPRGIAPSSDA